MSAVLRTPDEWSAIEDMVILDPDGWRDGGDWFEPISYEEFQARAARSTVQFRSWGSW